MSRKSPSEPYEAASPFESMPVPEEFAPPHPDFRSGMIAVVGCANAGKSSLVNRLLGEKVSIVSPIAQTTRNLVRGVLTTDDGQLVFLDTPGLHRPHGELGKRMNKTARASADDVDVVMLVLDRAKVPQEEDRIWMRQLTKQTVPVFLVLNKTDLPKNQAPAYHAAWAECASAREKVPEVIWMETSAETGDGVRKLEQALVSALPKGPLLFPENVLSDFPRRILVADIIREQLFEVLYGDVPHEIAVRVDLFDETETGARIDAKVLVNHPAQKGIVIGEKGRQLKKVVMRAERGLTQALDKPVKLTVMVKVEKDWQKNFWLLQQLGYDGTV